MRSSAINTSRTKIPLLLSLLVALAFLAPSCAVKNSGNAAHADSNIDVELKKIRTVSVVEDDRYTYLTIAGSDDLLFSDIRKSSPPTVSFYFPGTKLVDIQDVYHIDTPPIKEVHASEVVANGHTAKVTVKLTDDIDYRVDQGPEGITIAFARASQIDEETLAATLPAPDTGEAVPVVDPVAANPKTALGETIDQQALETAAKGTCIEMVDFKEQSDGVDIFILADGPLSDYSAFTIENPPRIVFDIYDISSPYSGLQKIEINSKWVKGVRHFCYPAKLRVVLDTDHNYLTTFTSKPVKNGLRINVAETKQIFDDALIQTVAIDSAGTIDVNSEVKATADKEESENADIALVHNEPKSKSATANPEEVVAAANSSSNTARGENTETAAVSETPLLVAAASGSPETPALSEPAADTVMAVETVVAETATAWLNKLEFTSIEEGASLVSIGTTKPVRYDMVRLSDRKLQLKLYRTRIPEYRKRPLITTRFKSAVDRITPIESEQESDLALVVFDLREGVPFEMAQVDNFINIRFAASTIPPKPLEKSAEPEWKQTLEGTAETSAPTTPAKAAADAEGTGGEVSSMDAAGLRSPKSYSGEKIALNFFDTDIRNVFRIIGEISGENFAIDKNVQGKVTLQFDKPVPWDQVLDLVLRMNQLGLRKENGIFRIATQATLAREEQLEQQKLESQRSADEQQELVTEFFLLSYINAQETACAHLAATCDHTKPEVGWPSKFSPRGSVSIDTGKNMIIVNEIPSAVERVRSIIRMLDQVTPQVLIEARIVEASSDFRRDVGFDWGTISIGEFDLGDVFTVTGIDMEGDNIPDDALDNGAIDWGLSKISGTDFDIIDARIQVGETEGKTRTISAPKILTLDGRTARIQQGFQIPYLERDSAGGSSIEFQDVDLELSVTPNVTPDERVLLVVDIKKDDVLDTTAAQPPLSTNSAHTELLMEDGETVVIGGVMKANTAESGEGIPGLRKIPALGFFFGFSSKDDLQNELLIFLTPEIVQLAQREVPAATISQNP